MERSARGATRLYVALGAMWGTAVGAYGLAVVTRWVTEVELSATQLILLGTAIELAAFVGEIPTGVVADVVSRKLSVVIAYALVGAAFVMSASDQFVVLLLSQVLFGLGWTFRSGAETAWMTDEVDDQPVADRNVLRQQRWSQLGGIVGLVVAVVIGSASLTVVIVGSGVVLVATSGALVTAMRETRFEASSTGRLAEARAVLRDGATTVRRSAVLTAVFVAAFVGGLANEAVDRLKQLRLVEIGLPDLAGFEPVVWFGLIGLVARLAVVVVLRMVEQREMKLRGMVLATGAGLFVGAGVTAAGLAWGTTFGVAATMLVGHQVIRWLLEPLTVTIVNRRATSASRATVLSFHSQADGVGQIIGGVALAVVAAASTTVAALTVSAALFVLAGLVMARAAARNASAVPILPSGRAGDVEPERLAT